MKVAQEQYFHVITFENYGASVYDEAKIKERLLDIRKQFNEKSIDCSFADIHEHISY